MANRYFFQHFRRSRPYYNRDFMRELSAAMPQGRKRLNDVVFDAIVRAARAAGAQLEGLLRHNFLSHEGFSAQCMAQLEADGFPVYDMEPSLVEALARTDAGEMRIEDLRTPNYSYFLHWGAQSHLLLHGKYPVEGAFVFSHDADWRIGLVARTPHAWLMAPERDVFQLRFPAECRPLPFDQAVELALRRDREDLEAARASVAPENLGLVDEALQELERNSGVLREALHLVGNCIAYLTAYPEDSRFDWEVDAPQSMLVKLQRGGKEAQRTTSKLGSMGFIQVHKVGLDFLRSAERAEAAPGGGHGLKPHWRRGHWRHQPYGERHALRKLIWLRPMRVLGGPSLEPDSPIQSSAPAQT